MTPFHEQFNELVKVTFWERKTDKRPDRWQLEHTGGGRVIKNPWFLSG